MGRKKQIQEAVNRVKGGLTITKVTSTRAVKTRKSGDFFVGMSAAWNSTQDDAGGMGADEDLTLTTQEQSSAGMSIIDAQIAQQILNKEASIAAWRSALTEGAISESAFYAKVREIRANTIAHIDRIIPECADD